MTETNTIHPEAYPDPHHDVYSKTTMGFWVYLITDYMLFATLFAAYAVLQSNRFGGPPLKDLVSLNFLVVQAIVLLFASFTSGVAGAFAHRKNKNATITFFAITFVLGVIFAWMQFESFSEFVQSGNDWKRSGFLSGFFTLIGTHWLHVLFGLLMTVVLVIPVFFQGINDSNLRRLTCLRMFWQFLNIIWSVIFMIIYLLGVVI